ncbi:acyl carrier protein [Rufibacter sp. XAAS-G3-1]|uniref:acyl carrier protein n=1 Tax=Rufibacter sp. XAAS-G3-1 TaxID=2729134 RepID=UPI0015E72BBB|nr:acyl carrier protein [Rufibacter sp. XAAS-G3-1]
MIAAAVPPSVTQKVVKIISKVKSIQPSRLRISTDLSKEFGFDTVDLVSTIWELEKSFKIEIPDEVPLNTVGDFVEFVSYQTKKAS